MRIFKFLREIKSYPQLLLFLVILISLSSCKSEYDQLVKSELASGVQHDSLIFNMFLGDKKAEFFSNCWELNKQKIVSQGTGNQYARFVEPVDSSNTEYLRKQMDFYGIFDKQDVMKGMEMIFQYVAWSPWNEEVQSDALLEILKSKFLIEYPGNDFIAVDIKEENNKAFVKVDGNMQILMFQRGVKEVVVKMEDLNFKLSN